MREHTLILEKVTPSKTELVDNKFYRLEFTGLNNQIYTAFVDKKDVDNEVILLNDTFDVIKVDIFRDNLNESVNDNIFETQPHLKYEGVYSYITIDINHTDPAVFNRI
jgi:hypothetical protein